MSKRKQSTSLLRKSERAVPWLAISDSAAIERARLSFAEGEDDKRDAYGQFLTPLPTAVRMAKMIAEGDKYVRLLDAGAGIGSLTFAAVTELCQRKNKPTSIMATLYEIDERFLDELNTTLGKCAALCKEHNITFEFTVLNEDFIKHASEQLNFGDVGTYSLAILNPPYKKLNSDSIERKRLSAVDIEANNFYSAFVWLAVKLLIEGGQLVAITPRSFCNGPYFKPLRRFLASQTCIDRIHIFSSRSQAFKDDAVLQENIIYHLTKRVADASDVVSISASHGPNDDATTLQEVPYSLVIRPTDADKILHIVTDRNGVDILQHIESLPCTLDSLGLSVSTGRVVDFRARAFLRNSKSSEHTVPLLYAQHFTGGRVEWPLKNSKKSQYLVQTEATSNLLIPMATYVLVKRFSSKEEKRRIVAAVLSPDRMSSEYVGIENHLNYIHSSGSGIPMNLARGLMLFLNSSIADEYFRIFNGHTQVNATDLRSMRFPNVENLTTLGTSFEGQLPEQTTVDTLVGKLFSDRSSPIAAMDKIKEALEILKAIDMPREQLNERSALTLLSLLDLKPNSQWDAASMPMRGITEMMEYFSEHFGKQYAPNTRETVRRQTVHQFAQEGLILANPDNPERPVNSPKTVYQVVEPFLSVVRTYGTGSWDSAVADFKVRRASFLAQYNEERKLNRIPVTLPDNSTIELSQGGQNLLIKKVIEDFCSLFAHNGVVLYVGDAGDKEIVFDEAYLAKLGLVFDHHGKMPDVVVHLPAKNWLLLVEAVTSHGPVNKKRHRELKELFKSSEAGLVFVTAFLSRDDMMRNLRDIAWQTEVWNAEEPEHMIHFNGERFLGPY